MSASTIEELKKELAAFDSNRKKHTPVTDFKKCDRTYTYRKNIAPTKLHY